MDNLFSEELDKVLTVLENHGYQHPMQIHDHECDEANLTVFNVYTVDINNVLKYVSKYCQVKEQTKGYIEWCKQRETGLTERAKTNKKLW